MSVKTISEPAAEHSNGNGKASSHCGPAARDGRRYFESDPITWLIGQAVALLHAAGEERGFGHATELLARLGASDAVARVFHDARNEDAALRWSLLCVLAETNDPRAAGLFARIALDPIRLADGDDRFEGEVLVRAMAIEGLGRLAPSNPWIITLLHRIVEDQPERALRVEAAKAILAAAPEEAEALCLTLPEALDSAPAAPVTGMRAVARPRAAALHGNFILPPGFSL